MTTFQVCSCGKHGRLMFNGKAGIEFYSKEVAFNLAYTAILMERISEEDGMKIYHEIENSNLDQDSVEKELASKIDKWNQDRYNASKLGNAGDLFFQDSNNIYKLIHT